LLYFAYSYIAPAQPSLQVLMLPRVASAVPLSCRMQGIDSSSTAPSIAYLRLAWQHLVACHSELSRDPSLVSSKALIRFVFRHLLET
jgi:hypothetical protein